MSGGRGLQEKRQQTGSLTKACTASAIKPVSWRQKIFGRRDAAGQVHVSGDGDADGDGRAGDHDVHGGDHGGRADGRDDGARGHDDCGHDRVDDHDDDAGLAQSAGQPRQAIQQA